MNRLTGMRMQDVKVDDLKDMTLTQMKKLVGFLDGLLYEKDMSTISIKDILAKLHGFIDRFEARFDGITSDEYGSKQTVNINLTVKDLIKQIESILNPSHSTELLGVNIDNLCKLLHVVDDHNNFIIDAYKTVSISGVEGEHSGLNGKYDLHKVSTSDDGDELDGSQHEIEASVRNILGVILDDDDCDKLKACLSEIFEGQSDWFSNIANVIRGIDA